VTAPSKTHLLVKEGDALDSDGRVARGQLTRRRVAEALVALLNEGTVEPTAREIAERAGVSLRLVFHHFSDLEDLHRAVGELQFELHWSRLATVSSDLPLSIRTALVSKSRGDLYEEIGAVRRAGMRKIDTSEGIARVIDDSNELLRLGLESTFAPEITSLSRTGLSPTDLLDMLDWATSWESWERLRRHQKMSPDRAVETLRRILDTIFECSDFSAQPS
jgi:AcrR family transcriptional regulator